MQGYCSSREASPALAPSMEIIDCKGLDSIVAPFNISRKSTQLKDLRELPRWDSVWGAAGFRAKQVGALSILAAQCFKSQESTYGPNTADFS
jgi:hypothetical protein